MRQAIAFAIDRERINEIGARGTAFAGHGLLPSYYKDFYTEPEGELRLPVRPRPRARDARGGGWVEGDGGVREKDGQRLSFNLYVRSESQENIQYARLVKEMAAQIGVEFRVEVVSVDRLTELTVQQVDGKPAPDFDTFIWGWGGDPYDPGLLLALVTTKQIGGSSDSFYSNPEYDRLYEQQSGEFDVDARRELVRQMIELTQRDLPYIVLTVDPILQAYRTDRISGAEQQCPKPDGDLICDQVAYAPWLAMAPVDRVDDRQPDHGRGGDDGGGTSPVLYIVIALVAIGVIAAIFAIFRRRRADREAIEV